MPTLSAAMRLKKVITGRVLTPAERDKARLTDIFLERKGVDGVFEGGGALGAAYIGALRTLHDNGFWFKRIAGNSAGAITASMIAVGFTAPEMQWLSSAFPGADPVPASLAAVGIGSPVEFSKFLDVPNVATISTENKRKTLLWNLLHGTILDEIGKIAVPVPAQTTAVNAVQGAVLAVPVLGPAITAVRGGVGLLRTAINTALAPLPDGPLRVRDFMFDTSALRTALADLLWDAIAAKNPMQVLMTNLLHEGAIFEGDAALATLSRLFAHKVHNYTNVAAAPPPVLFKHVNKIPLAVIAADIDTGRMRVYSSQTHPDMEIAEAVRRSMSIPFVFEPRGRNRQIVDGGVFSNFPAWLFTPVGNQFWPAGSIDPDRLKMGFSLDDNRQPPSNTNPRDGRFPPDVSVTEVLSSVLIEQLVDAGNPRGLVESGVNSALGFAPEEGPRIELLDEIIGVAFRGVLNTEESTRAYIVKQLMSGMPYVDVSIPLAGFSAADFYVNEDEVALVEMWDRGWKSAAAAMSNAVNDSTIALTGAALKTASPFS